MAWLDDLHVIVVNHTIGRVMPECRQRRIFSNRVSIGVPFWCCSSVSSSSSGSSSGSLTKSPTLIGEETAFFCSLAKVSDFCHQRCFANGTSTDFWQDTVSVKWMATSLETTFQTELSFLQPGKSHFLQQKCWSLEIASLHWLQKTEIKKDRRSVIKLCSI